jgi:hypothetical protein
MEADKFIHDIAALVFTLLFLRIVCYYLLKWRIVLSR